MCDHDRVIYIYPEGKDEETASARIVANLDNRTVEIELADEPAAQDDANELMRLAKNVSDAWQNQQTPTTEVP